jgi:hypothetical protein
MSMLMNYQSLFLILLTLSGLTACGGGSSDTQPAEPDNSGGNTATPNNTAPLANAGIDTSVIDNNGDGSESIALNAISSTDSDGQIISYQWLESSTEIATGINPTVTLNVGSHNIQLIVTDDGGLTSSDSLIINIQNPATSTNTVSFQQRILDSTYQHGQNLHISDIDDDGDLDVTVAYSLSDQVVTYINGGNSNGGGTGQVWSNIQIASSNSIVAMDVAIADFDGDNNLDIASVGLFDRNGGFNSPGEVSWYQNPGNVSNTWNADHFTGLNLWGAIHIEAGDLSGDGRTDLIVSSIQMSDANENPQESGIYWFRNDVGTPVNWSSRITIDNTLNDVNSFVVIDVDNDNDLDVIAVGKISNEIVWYENQRTDVNATPTFAKHTIANLTQPVYVIASQLDSDSTPEIIVSYTNNSNGAIAWFDAQQNALDQLWTMTTIDQSLAFSANGEVHLTSADYNNDGLMDIAITSFNNLGQVYLREGANWSTPVSLTLPPSGLNHIASGDVNGDNRADLITTTYEFGSTERIDIWENQP